MAQAAQAALMNEIDPIAYKWAAGLGIVSAQLTSAAAQLSPRLYGALLDRATALLALNTIRRNNPNIGGGQLVSNGDPVSGSSSKSQSHLPRGYPSHWYTTPAGEELIGITESLTPPSFG